MSIQSFRYAAVSAALGVATPTLIQHVASSSNPVGIGISGDNFECPIPNPVGAGNCLVLCMTYPNGVTPTVSDNNSNSWPGSPSVSADGGSGNYVSAIFVLPNANVGQTTVKVAFGTSNATVIPFQYDISEFNNIALSSPLNGTTFTAVTQSSSNTLSAGSLTPTTNNDSNGGNVVVTYHCVGANAGGNPTTWAAGSGFGLLEADIAWTSGQGIPHASQWKLLTSNGVTPIPCSIGETGDAASFYNSVAVALKVASAGQPAASGIYINRIIHLTNQSVPASISLQVPTVGNLLVVTTTNPNFTSISDSQSGSWNTINSTGGAALCWSANRTPSLTTKVTMAFTGAQPTSWRFYDISGAATSPFDGSATTGSTTLNGATVFNNAPSITPTVSGDLVIAAIQLGQGPGLSISSPTNAVFDLCLHDVSSGQNPDQDLMENADGNGHLYNAPVSAENWDWAIFNQTSNSGTAVAAAFKHS